MKRSRKIRWRWTISMMMMSSLSLSETPGAILHEFIVPNPQEDLNLGATTSNGKFPAAIKTPSGIVEVPDPLSSSAPTRVYSPTSIQDSVNSTFAPDRDTKAPERVFYDDPFSPSIAPFKRLRAYDAVSENYELYVRDRSLVPLTMDSEKTGDELFFCDIVVDLLASTPVRLPSVAPGARLIKAFSVPETSLEFLHDGADNWFVRSSHSMRIRLVMQIAANRLSFGSEFENVDFDALRSSWFPPPVVLEDSISRVAHTIGITSNDRPRTVVHKMVEYFRSFQESEEPLVNNGNIYLDLALSKRGVCRHRAFAFLVTALGLRIPARMVVNEAHAWVEVYDSKKWQRIDLGGAASQMEETTSANTIPYQTPPDPYPWPANATKGSDLVSQQKDSKSNTSEDTSSTTKSNRLVKQSSVDILFHANIDHIRRGASLQMTGHVQSKGKACIPNVIVSIRSELGVETDLSKLSVTNDAFEGEVTVPSTVDLGSYRLLVRADEVPCSHD